MLRKLAQRRRWLRRLFNMQPYEIAWVRYGANHRTFAVVKEDSMSMPNGLTLQSVEKAHGILGELVTVFKTGAPMDDAAVSAVVSKLDAVADLILPPEDAQQAATLEAPPAAQAQPTTALKELVVNLRKNLEAIASQAIATDYTLGDQVDSALGIARQVESAVVDGVEAAPASGDPIPASDPVVAAAAAASSDPAPTADAAPAEADKAATPPAGYPEDKGQYLDPDNYKYPIDTEAHVRAALSYLSQADNAKLYSESQLASMWSKLRAAAEKFGIQVSETTGKAEKQAPCDEEDQKNKTMKAEATQAASAPASVTAASTPTADPAAAPAPMAETTPSSPATLEGAPGGITRDEVQGIVKEAIGGVLDLMKSLKDSIATLTVQKAAPMPPVLPATNPAAAVRTPQTPARTEDPMEFMDLTQSADLENINEYGVFKR